MRRTLPDILPVDWPTEQAEPSWQTEQALDRATQVLIAGGLVAIPTETVYGLAAVALDSMAVQKIFAAKGRPQTNPLIVHVADVAMAQSLAADWPAAAETICELLWPGPITVVVPRAAIVPDAVTAGGSTVALRCPEHRLTRRLIAKLGVPLAAPSANRSLGLSPTTAGHVAQSLGSRIDLILDGGPCRHGIESTVVDCTTTPPRILRLGPIHRDQLEKVLGQAVAITSFDVKGVPSHIVSDAAARSPGMLARHYAPRTPLQLSTCSAQCVARLVQSGKRVGWLTFQNERSPLIALAASHSVILLPMPLDPDACASQLYATLHAIDQQQLDMIIVDMPPATDAWGAIRDRLARASIGPQEKDSRSPDSNNTHTNAFEETA